METYLIVGFLYPLINIILLIYFWKKVYSPQKKDKIKKFYLHFKICVFLCILGYVVVILNNLVSLEFVRLITLWLVGIGLSKCTTQRLNINLLHFFIENSTGSFCLKQVWERDGEEIQYWGDLVIKGKKFWACATQNNFKIDVPKKVITYISIDDSGDVDIILVFDEDQ